MPRAVAERRTPPGDGPVFLDPPTGNDRYAHRQGHLAVQLPAGARDLRLQLLKHEDFVFGTAYGPETVPGETSWTCGPRAAGPALTRVSQHMHRVAP